MFSLPIHSLSFPLLIPLHILPLPLSAPLPLRSLVSPISSVSTQKKLKTQDWAITKPKKTQGQISIHFREIFGKNRTFPEKKQTFPEKMSFFPPKFLMTFFSQILTIFRQKCLTFCGKQQQK